MEPFVTQSIADVFVLGDSREGRAWLLCFSSVAFGPFLGTGCGLLNKETFLTMYNPTHP